MYVYTFLRTMKKKLIMGILHKATKMGILHLIIGI